MLCHGEPERQHCSQRLAGTPRRPGCRSPRYLRALATPLHADRNEPTLNEAAIGDVRHHHPYGYAPDHAKAGVGRITVCLCPARGCSVGSLKPAPATSACGNGLEGGDKTGTAGSSGTANDGRAFGRQAPAVTAGSAGDLLSHPICGSARAARCRDCCCRPRGGEASLASRGT